MKKKILGLIVTALVICAFAAFAAVSFLGLTETPKTPTGELDFTVSGTSDCLRFLNSSVPIVYVPFTVAANEQMQLTVNCTKMPGGANGWTDVYIYNNYWDKGTNHTCKSWDVYPIINDIDSANFELKANDPYTQTFGETTQKSYTIFFVLPPGGPAAFHITLKPT